MAVYNGIKCRTKKVDANTTLSQKYTDCRDEMRWFVAWFLERMESKEDRGYARGQESTSPFTSSRTARGAAERGVLLLVPRGFLIGTEQELFLIGSYSD